MGLGAVDFGVGETNKNTEFGLGPWTGVGRKLLSNGIGCSCLLGWGNKLKTKH